MAPIKKQKNSEDIGEDADASEGIDEENLEDLTLEDEFEFDTRGRKRKVRVKKEPLPQEEKQTLTKRQEIFCQYFAKDKECFGIGVRAYLKAYPDCGYDSAKSNAYHLLTNHYILARIDELMEVFVNDQIVDKELQKVILQSGNLNAKVRAINEHNKVHGRIVDKHDITTKGNAIVLDDTSRALADAAIAQFLNGRNTKDTTEQG